MPRAVASTSNVTIGGDNRRIADSPREVVEKVLGHWTRDESLPEGLLDPDVEWVNPPDAIERGTRSGRGGWGGAEENWRQGFSSIRFEVERVEAAGDRVATAVRCFSVARGSGLEVEQVLGFLFTVRDGRVVRFEWSNDAEGTVRSVLA
jgi:ketosteroid isomerase-like protein